MGAAVYTPKQQNWRWYQDDAAEPVNALANENIKPTLSDNTNKIRLRVCVNETGGKADNSVTITVQYSLNDIDFTAFGAANHWNYADGQAIEGNTTTTFKLSDTTTHNEYCESGANVVSIGASTINELDICIKPTTTVQANTTYYFRILGDAVVIPLNTGETHSQVLTAATAYILDVQPGSYSEGGILANLLKNSVLTAGVDSYGLIGTLTGLFKNYLVDAGVSNYSLTGSVVNFLRNYLIAVEMETYSLVGTESNLIKNIILSVELGNYSSVGSNVVFVWGRTLVAGIGSYALTGSTVNLFKNYLVATGIGSYSLSGTAIDFLRNYLISINVGSYVELGQEVSLVYIGISPGSNDWSYTYEYK